MSTSLSKYKIWCVTDNQYEYIWSETEPLVCPINNTHTINIDSIVVIDEIASNIMKIREENIPTGENFQCECYNIEYTGGTGVETSTDFTWPHPINVLELQFVSTDANKGDSIRLVVAPNTIIGVITANVSISDKIINVSSTVLDNVMIGYHLDLFDGANTFDCGRITSVDKVNNQVTVENSLTQSFSASSPTYVRLSVYVVNNYIIGPPQRYVIGEGKIGGSYVPTNTIVRVSITNSSNLPKTFSAQLEYLY